jgi:hypothetical protein
MLVLDGGALQVRNVPVPRTNYALPWWLVQKSSRVLELRSAQLLRSLLVEPKRQGKDDVRAEFSKLLELSVAVFDDLQRVNREKHSTLVLLYLPTTRDRRSGHSGFWRQALRREADRRGWVLIDLVDEYRKLDRKRSRGFFRPDGHYTPKGNDWVARTLYRRLRALPPLQPPARGGAGD